MGLSRSKTHHIHYFWTLQITWPAVLTQEHTIIIDDETLKHQHPITYVSSLFQGNQLNWTALTKKE